MILDIELFQKCLGRAIFSVRSKQHLTIDQLAERSRVGVNTIRRIERGENAQADTLLEIAVALGVWPSDLVQAAEDRYCVEDPRALKQ